MGTIVCHHTWLSGASKISMCPSSHSVILIQSAENGSQESVLLVGSLVIAMQLDWGPHVLSQDSIELKPLK